MQKYVWLLLLPPLLLSAIVFPMVGSASEVKEYQSHSQASFFGTYHPKDPGGRQPPADGQQGGGGELTKKRGKQANKQVLPRTGNQFYGARLALGGLSVIGACLLLIKNKQPLRGES